MGNDRREVGGWGVICVDGNESVYPIISGTHCLVFFFAIYRAFNMVMSLHIGKTSASICEFFVSTCVLLDLMLQ